MTQDFTTAAFSGSRPEDGAADQQPALGPRLRELAQREHAFIWRLCRRMGLSREDADDLTQEVFLVALRRLENIASGSERAFLIGSAVRVLRTQRRGFARRYRAMAGWTPAEAQPSPEQLVQCRDDLVTLDLLLQSLPLGLRSVFVLFELEGVAEPEIARALDIPRGTVASRLRRARKAFENGVKRLQARQAAKGGQT
jgi:RNA polymerase sigma-70 factor (ECF subfamily)